MKTNKYTLKDGQYMMEIKSGEVFRISCCDCGLAHRVCIIVKRSRIGIAMERDLKVTRRIRKTKEILKNIWLLSSMFNLPPILKNKKLKKN